MTGEGETVVADVSSGSIDVKIKDVGRESAPNNPNLELNQVRCLLSFISPYKSHGKNG